MKPGGDAMRWRASPMPRRCCHSMQLSSTTDAGAARPEVVQQQVLPLSHPFHEIMSSEESVRLRQEKDHGQTRSHRQHRASPGRPFDSPPIWRLRSRGKQRPSLCPPLCPVEAPQCPLLEIASFTGLLLTGRGPCPDQPDRKASLSSFLCTCGCVRHARLPRPQPM